MSDSRARQVLGGGDHKGGSKSKSSHKGKVHTIHVRRGAGGGFISRVEREQDPNDPAAGQASGPEEYALADQDQLNQHIGEQMGDQPAVGEAPEAAAAGAAPAPPAVS